MSNVSAHSPVRLRNALRDAKVPTITKLWNLIPTGKWGQDNKAGQRFANSLLRDMQKSGEATKLEAVIREMVALGPIDGTHIGFLHRISTLALKAYMVGL